MAWGFSSGLEWQTIGNYYYRSGRNSRNPRFHQQSRQQSRRLHDVFPQKGGNEPGRRPFGNAHKNRFQHHPRIQNLIFHTTRNDVAVKMHLSPSLVKTILVCGGFKGWETHINQGLRTKPMVFLSGKPKSQP